MTVYTFVLQYTPLNVIRIPSYIPRCGTIQTDALMYKSTITINPMNDTDLELCSAPICVSYTPPAIALCDHCHDPVEIILTRLEFINELLVVTGWHWEHGSTLAARNDYEKFNLDNDPRR